MQLETDKKDTKCTYFIRANFSYKLYPQPNFLYPK